MTERELIGLTNLSRGCVGIELGASFNVQALAPGYIGTEKTVAVTGDGKNMPREAHSRAWEHPRECVDLAPREGLSMLVIERCDSRVERPRRSKECLCSRDWVDAGGYVRLGQMGKAQGICLPSCLDTKPSDDIERA